MRKDPTEFRKRFQRWKAGEKVYEAGKISDQQYYDIMERVAEQNNAEWNKDRRSEGSPELSVDEEFTRILNDNTYDYRGYYNKYPRGKGNAIDHWTDEFKTVYHPTFSVYSKYSGKKSQYNPEGVLGGRWDGERYVPAWGQKLPKYGDGKGNNMNYEYRGTVYEAGLPKFADGTEGRSYGYQTEDKHPIKFDEQGNLVDQITGNVGTMRLPEVQVSTANPKNYRSSYDPDAIRNFTDWLPLAGDAGIGVDIADAIKKDDYIQAGVLGGMALLPNIIKKPLKYISKPIKRFITNGSVQKRIIDASRTLNFTKDWDNDTYARWMLNGQKTPEFKYVWHGRGTDRGKPEFALRTYSDKDVGLHLTENKPTAERFAKKNGVVYQGVDYGTYPDAIYADINTWRAKDWLDLIRQGDELTPKIEKEAAMHFSQNVVDKSHGKIKSIRDLAKQFSLKRDEIASFAKKYDNAGLDWVDREDANRQFSEYLKQHGVNFKYMNEFEGGGYEKPSIFISDPSNIRWIPEIRLKPTDGQKIEMIHYLDWKNRKISRFKEPYTFIQ